MSGQRTTGTDSKTVSRRSVLRAGGATGVLGLTGLAGCTEDGGSGGTNGTDGGTTAGGDIGTVTLGVMDPLSGSYAALGQSHAWGAEVGVNHVNNGVIDDYDFELEMVGPIETDTEPAGGTQAAQRLVEQDGAEYLAGAVSSSVSLAVSDYANNAGACYMSTSSSWRITGSDCGPYTFRETANSHMISIGLVRSIVQQDLGSKVWIHLADYEYGTATRDNVQAQIEQRDGVEVVGTNVAPLGETNFGSYISEISNSEADCVVIANTGGDMINFLSQAADQGLTDEANVIGGTTSLPVVYNALGPAADGVYSTERYPKEMDIGDNQQFVSDYRDVADDGQTPTLFSYGGYAAARYFAQGIAEAGTSDPTEVKDVLPGTIDSVLGDVELRECDHQAMVPLWTARMDVPEGQETANIETLSRLEPDQVAPSCEETGCDL